MGHHHCPVHGLNQSEHSSQQPIRSELDRKQETGSHLKTPPLIKNSSHRNDKVDCVDYNEDKAVKKEGRPRHSLPASVTCRNDFDGRKSSFDRSARFGSFREPRTSRISPEINQPLQRNWSMRRQSTANKEDFNKDSWKKLNSLTATKKVSPI